MKVMIREDVLVILLLLASAIVLAAVKDVGALCVLNATFVTVALVLRMATVDLRHESAFGGAWSHCACFRHRLNMILSYVLSIGALIPFFSGVVAPKFIYLKTVRGETITPDEWGFCFAFCEWLVWAVAGVGIDLICYFKDISSKIADCRLFLILGVLASGIGLTFAYVHSASWVYAHYEVCYPLFMGIFILNLFRMMSLEGIAKALSSLKIEWR